MPGGREAAGRREPGRGPGPALGLRIVLGSGLLLLLLATVLVVSGTSAISRQGFDSMRRRGLAVARILALAAANSGDPQGAGRLRPLIDQIATDGDLVYVGIVDRDGAVVAEA